MVSRPSPLSPEAPGAAAPDSRAWFGGQFSGCRVLVTGHTGFKGAWLCEWLLQLGADVTGVALAPPTQPALFDQLGLAQRVRHVVADVRDLGALQAVVARTRPHFVFHLAAQALVRRSYAEPVDTYATNVMGTVNLLEAVRRAQAPCVVVVVTTDKCYENREWVHSYREEDAMGGFDPYSSSKGAAELVVAAYRRSFFDATHGGAVRIATARAGNVVGGGDWAADRIVPDCIRALREGRPVPVRNKVSTRPWQHVLEPLGGYLWLAACLQDPDLARRATGRRAEDSSRVGAELASAYNFGPALTSNRTVADLVQTVLKHWPGSWEDRSEAGAVHEATLLNLSTDKAHHRLGWRPVWDFEQTIRQTILWYQSAAESPDRIAEFTRGQIAEYADGARTQGLAWANAVAPAGWNDPAVRLAG